MQLEFNIGLPDSIPSEAALKFAKVYFTAEGAESVYVRLHDSSYQGPRGPVHERTIVAIVISPSGVTHDFYVAKIGFGLCTYFEQDCVAVRIPALRIGTLIGPRAEEWGDFDNNKFIPFVVAEKQQD